MGCRSCLCFVLLVLLCDAVLSAPTNYRGLSEGGGEPCQPDKLTVYKVILHTFWTRDKFPKHYPDWRPPAQWTKVFGKLFVPLKLTGYYIEFENFNVTLR